MNALRDVAGHLTCTVPEAGQLLGIGRDAAYAAAARGEIPTLRLGRSLRVPVPKLLELLGVTPQHGAEPDQDSATAHLEQEVALTRHDDTKPLRSA